MFSYIENACEVGEFNVVTDMDVSGNITGTIAEPEASGTPNPVVPGFVYGVKITSPDIDGSPYDYTPTNDALRGFVQNSSLLRNPRSDKTIITTYNFFDRSTFNSIIGSYKGGPNVYLGAASSGIKMKQGFTYAPGLPNICGTITGHGTDHSSDNKAFPSATGAFSVVSSDATTRARNNGSNKDTGVAFSASNYDERYGKTSSVMPATFITALCIGY